MAQFEIKIDHSLGAEEARTRLKGAQGKLESEYGVACQWAPGGDMKVSRKGLDGVVVVREDHLAVTVKLGFLLSAVGGPIKEGITTKLTKLMQA